MASLADIRAGIAANLATLQGMNVSAYMQASPTLPMIWVRPSAPDGIEYHRAFADGVENWTMLVQAFVGVSSDIGAQKLLDTLLASSGATSVKAAIESDKTLGGAAQSLIVTTCTGYQEYGRPDGTTTWLGCEWTVVVTP